MASFLLSEVYIVEKVVAAGHPDLDDLTCEATVCTSQQQAYYEAIRSMIHDAVRDKNQCEGEEEESLRCELAKTMRRRGVTLEKRYLSLKEIIINASRVFGAEKTYYTVKRSAIVPHRPECADEETVIADALALLGSDQHAKEKADHLARTHAKQQPRGGDSSRGRVPTFPQLPADKDDGISRKKARAHKR